MFRSLLVICFFFPILLFAQAREVQYFNKQNLNSSKHEAEFYRVFVQDSNGYILKEYTMNDVLRMEGHVTSVGENYTKSKQGKFVFYDLNGYVTKEGTYIAGKMDGIWAKYFEGTKELKTEIRYNNGSIEKERSYDSTKKYLSEETEYRTGNGSIFTKYYSNGKIKAVSYWGAKGDLVSRKCFNEAGVQIDCDNSAKTGEIFKFVEQMPSPAYNIMAYLQQNIKYPRLSLNSGRQGRVSVEFVIYEDGSINDVAIVDGVCADIDAEALRVIEAMPKWIPGKQNGKPVKVKYTQPINFKLN